MPKSTNYPSTTGYRDSIEAELRRNPRGLTWKELQDSLGLPYTRPCPTWVARLEKEISLSREGKKGRALLWKL